MPISRVADKLWRLTPRRLVWAGALATAAIAGATDPRSGIVNLVIRAVLWFVGAALFGLTLEAIRGAPVDRRAILAYVPMACASLAFFLARETAASVIRSGSLDNFFGTAASLLGLLLVSLVVEARRVATHDQWLRALRGWWVAFIVIGILYALVGLTPGQSQTAQMAHYAWVWAGLVGAVVALTVVMWRDADKQPGALPPEQEMASRQERTRANGLATGAASTSTRAPVRSTRAAHRAARR